MAKKRSDSLQDETCVFCGKTQLEVGILVQGENASICDVCILHAHQIVEAELLKGNAKKSNNKAFQLPEHFSPKFIKNYLDLYVVGQDEAKKTLSVAVYNHYKRLTEQKDNDVEIEKSNVLFIGPTGTGKTLMAKSLAKLLDVPFAIVDATSFTEAGYVGEDVEGMLSRLLQSCDYDILQAEKGIIYIDEMDKISRRSENPSLTKDVGGEGVQQAMLKIIEGADVNVPPAGGRKHPEQQFLKLNTQNILFICGGAFDSLEKIIAKRLNTHVIGYSQVSERVDANEESLMKYVNHQDLKKFGLIPELLGRLPVLAYLESLSKESLMEILTLPKNAIIKQYQKLFAMDNIQLEFKKEAVSTIAELAFENKLGARGLRSICESVLKEAMFETDRDKSSRKITIDKAYVLKRIDNQLIKKSA
ncbi:MAG: ATP-dependent Clp protease ATP-binding subunit ClpX [Saprospiraceae bacterium]|nr:ATP-dependent Clp protease ATP-binding subunit ClpX [Saprospiraceae bacterium]